MYKALNYWVYGGFSGEKSPYEFIDYAAAKGLDGVELTVGDALKNDISAAECGKIAAYAAKKHIGLRTLATGQYWGLSLGSPDASAREAAKKFTLRYLEIANAIGAGTVLIVPGATRVAWEPSIPIVPYRTVWENSIKSITELLPAAEKLGVVMALENVWNRFLLSPMEWKFYLDNFPAERVGIYFDAGNCCIHARPEDYAEILGSRIKAVHLKNFTETDCAGGLHGFGDDLCSGEVDFKKLFAALEQNGYQGPFTVEMIPFSRLPDLVLPDAALADATVAKLLAL